MIDRERPAMSYGTRSFLSLLVALSVIVCCCLLSYSRAEERARLKTGDVVDDYFGNKVADPYRWLEDDDAPETRSFVDEHNLAFRSFVQGDVRERFKTRIRELANYPKIGAPHREGTRYFFSKNEGLQNQSVLYVRDGSLDAEPRTLIDPNTLSTDGTVALSGLAYTHDGEMLAYGISSGGSDQKVIRVRRIADGKDLDDKLEWCKFSGVAWSPDKSGFWYNRYPKPGEVPKEDQARYNKLYFHKLGSPQADDSVVYDPGDRELNVHPGVTEEDDYLLLELSRGSTPKNRLYYRKLDSKSPAPQGDFVKLFDAEDAEYSYLGHDGGVFYVVTNEAAPRKRIIAVDTAKPSKENWRELIPQATDAISGADMVNDEFVVSYMHDAHEIVKVFGRDGKFDREIKLPALGSVQLAPSKRPDKRMFINFASYTYPQTVLKYDFASGATSVYHESKVKFRPEDYESRQVFVTSKDGTKVPLFVTYKKGVVLDGTAPTILNGYGGFNISETPYFSATRIAWLEQGGVFAAACLRGGGEYGEEWHQAGMLDRKQNVFDDFQACAQWLIDNNYTSSKRLAIQGGSNGGLLVAACITQRPDLFGAALCQVPLTDMLRYDRFSVGRFWIPEYGSARASEAQFKTLCAYSPLQNVKEGVSYPPTLITTAEGDDRVVPLHARKFTATLQAKGSGGPIFLRTETKAGHGGGKPISKSIDEAADMYAFLAKVFEMDVRE